MIFFCSLGVEQFEKSLNKGWKELKVQISELLF